MDSVDFRSGWKVDSVDLRSDYMDAQAGLELHSTHMYEDPFSPHDASQLAKNVFFPVTQHI